MRALNSFLLLFAFWILLSGKFDLFHLALGVISAAIVTKWSGDLLFEDASASIFKKLKFALKFVLYFVWLNIEIVKSTLYVTYLAFHPNLKEKLCPKMMKVKNTADAFEQYFLANSITLTPGTITVTASKKELLVHAITEDAASACPGKMPEYIKRMLA